MKEKWMGQYKPDKGRACPNALVGVVFECEADGREEAERTLWGLLEVVAVQHLTSVEWDALNRDWLFVTEWASNEELRKREQGKCDRSKLDWSSMENYRQMAAQRDEQWFKDLMQGDWDGFRDPRLRGAKPDMILMGGPEVSDNEWDWVEFDLTSSREDGEANKLTVLAGDVRAILLNRPPAQKVATLYLDSGLQFEVSGTVQEIQKKLDEAR